MQSFIENLINQFFTQGELGVLSLIMTVSLLSIYGILFFLGRTHLQLLEQCLNEQQVDKQCILTTLQNNTIAITENMNALEKCTEAVVHNNQLIQHALLKL